MTTTTYRGHYWALAVFHHPSFTACHTTSGVNSTSGSSEIRENVFHAPSSLASSDIATYSTGSFLCASLTNS